ncbi:hypothetical protein [Acrocarpospora pleiomorpha]|uniref:hypothetical protein n=1 Tax=Acrocarpospora pleiomorpha TaxID=90975 RepID=UPI0012D2F435|nr:hypothetical protein [Acrocarpospora pleiomorpha]
MLFTRVMVLAVPVPGDEGDALADGDARGGDAGSTQVADAGASPPGVTSWRTSV